MLKKYRILHDCGDRAIQYIYVNNEGNWDHICMDYIDRKPFESDLDLNNRCEHIAKNRLKMVYPGYDN